MQHILYKIFVVVILAVLCAVAVGGASQSTRWEISTIEIRGTQAVSQEEVWNLTNELLKGNYYFLYARDNSFIFPRYEIETRLSEAFPRIKSVHIHREGAHTIVVEITERKPFMLWCGESFEGEKPELTECWFVDDRGFVFDRAPIFSEGVYREVYAPLMYRNESSPLHAVIPLERFLFANSLIEGFERGVGEISRVFIKKDGEYGMVVRSSVRYPELVDAELYFKDGQSSERLIYNILSALPVQFPPDVISEKKLLYVDLRFGNKVFFGFAESAQP